VTACFGGFSVLVELEAFRAGGFESIDIAKTREREVVGRCKSGRRSAAQKVDQLHAEVISIVASKCVDPKSKRGKGYDAAKCEIRG
jgi:hypothetical protein